MKHYTRVLQFGLLSAYAARLARLGAFMILAAFPITSSACDDSCNITSGLGEPYKAAVRSPETFDQWVDQHPNYFTEARVACLVQKEKEAYQRELDLLAQCDRHFAGDAQGLDFCRSSIESPETFTAFWRDVLRAANGQDFLSTPVGFQIYVTKQDDPAFYNAMTSEIFNKLGEQIEEGLQCKKCSKPWWNLF